MRRQAALKEASRFGTAVAGKCMSRRPIAAWPFRVISRTETSFVVRTPRHLLRFMLNQLRCPKVGPDELVMCSCRGLPGRRPWFGYPVTRMH